MTWCTDHDLQLNSSKTKELIVDPRRKPSTKTPVLIKGEPISITDTFKLLGTHISNNLKWKINADHIYKKSPAKTLPSPTAQEVQSKVPSTAPLLHSHRRKHPHLIHHSLVRQSRLTIPEEITAHHLQSIKNHFLTPTIPSTHCTTNGHYAEPARSSLIPLTPHTMPFNYCPLGGVTGQLPLTQPASRTVSFPVQSLS